MSKFFLRAKVWDVFGKFFALISVTIIFECFTGISVERVFFEQFSSFGHCWFAVSLLAENMLGFGMTSKTRRPMKYPYTLSAQIAQFPFKYYYKNVWVFRYYVYGFFVSMPVFYYMQTLACSPQNTEKWNEIRRREREEALEHLR